MKILLIGSDGDSSGSLAGFLQEAGYETLSPAPEGSRTDAPDALVLDALAPAGMARRALEDSPGRKRAPLILITEAGCPNPLWITPGREADAVLPKPLDVRNLVGLLRTFQGLGELPPGGGRPAAGFLEPARGRGKASRRRRT
jgi:DNA-binding response OmpR family regulator